MKKGDDRKEEELENELDSQETFMEDKYLPKRSPISDNVSEAQKELLKTKKEVENLKSFILKKYEFTQAIGILPPQTIKLFIDEEEIPKETEKFMHLYMIIPEEQFKNIPKIRQEIVKELEKTKEKIWLQIKTPVDVWENCLDSKFGLTEAIAMSYPIYDKGILGALRLAEIHKSLVLQKFEKYVVSYVIAGSLVRGDTVPTSDVDIFVVINDTDVKRMPRLELKERLRGIIYQYIQEATALAGVKNLLNVQVYLLTEFWEAVKDAHPVIFTFIRDGIPLHDRGTFMPWKALLKMGKLKPSPEAIDMFMSMGDKTAQRAKMALLDIVIRDLYWGVLTPTQAIIMLYGLPPPTTKEAPKVLKEVFVDKEKMLEKKYSDFFSKVIQIYKDFEHEKIKEIKGAELDKLIEGSEEYLKRLKELKEQIEKHAQEKTIEQIHQDLVSLLESVTGKKLPAAQIEEFEENFIKSGKFSQQHLRILKDVLSAKTDFKKGKLDSQKVDDARKNASILINDLIEYTQRCDLVNLEKGRLRLKFKKEGKEHTAELLSADGKTFLFVEKNIRKIDHAAHKVENSTMEEVTEAVEKQKSKKALVLSPHIFELIKKELGDYEIIF